MGWKKIKINKKIRTNARIIRTCARDAPSSTWPATEKSRNIIKKYHIDTGRYSSSSYAPRAWHCTGNDNERINSTSTCSGLNYRNDGCCIIFVFYYYEVILILILSSKFVRDRRTYYSGSTSINTGKSRPNFRYNFRKKQTHRRPLSTTNIRQHNAHNTQVDDN